MKDLIIVGAGPVGIYAAYIAALRGLRVSIIEASSAPGGQATNVFGKKAVYDMPGHVNITGEDLIKFNLKQLETKKELVEIFTNEGIRKLECGENNTFHVCTSERCHIGKAVILATGNGIYKPRPLGIEHNDTKNIIYTVSNFEDFIDKNIVVFGGGDSALDWANMIASNGAKKVTLIHRRNEFRAKGDSITTFNSYKNTEILTPFSPKAVEIIDKKVKTLTIKSIDEEKTIKADFILVNFGAQLNKDLIELKEELKLDQGKIAVNGWCKTSTEGIWAIGNACHREGKVTVIVSGYGEAVSAVASVATYLDPNASPLFLSSINLKKE